ncbi:heavy-metal-associated domain-containing protein [Microbacterium oxydans]|jgi:copper chaperone CopZ|uniref:heavy-metal-associated domain-containing protein n=1 Tax=Microbacteriaceae TaxID=85023 RepID=UPI00039BE2AE|nr:MULTISPECIES: heavy-metal-associated domain-containing protein [Microbacteriaceae]EYT55757.1 heavy metal transporter [Leucobacter sp. UCD-THU]MBE7954631.1 heavy-metal-associated domain-containing protein [Microbacterium sp. R1]MCB8045306.1 heavy-metal-associated domain-containing protein [Microbacterium oxydans]MCT2225229.1 heavy-metal-associated domain-containing protein [Microbacterium paraoxydans]
MSTTTTEFQVTGMSCGHCETAIRSEVSEIPGVTGIEVSAQTGRLAVTAEQPIEDATVIAAVDEAGYTAVRS